MDDQPEDQPQGRADFVAFLYIIGGIPMIVGFLVVLFWFARSCNIPA